VIPTDPFDRAIANAEANAAISRLEDLSFELCAALGDAAVIWRVAGSLRRYLDMPPGDRFKIPGDIEIVAVPDIRHILAEQATLFGEPEQQKRIPVNALFARLDQLIADGVPGWRRHPRITTRSGGSRAAPWGDRYRRFLYKGVAVDLFTASASWFGHTLLIRTGPAEYSKRYVAGLKSAGFVCKSGQVALNGELYPIGDERVCFAVGRVANLSPGEREKRYGNVD